jgi:P-type E1-E2 ATPase
MKEFQFVGFVTMNDPVRKEVIGAISRLKEANMQVVLLTGDEKEPAM